MMFGEYVNLWKMGLLQQQLLKPLRKRARYPKAPTLGERVEFPWENYDQYNCFGCCSRNSRGLKAAFFKSPDADLACSWTATNEYENYPGMLHGGVSTTILDELMGQTVVKVSGHLPVSIKAEVTWLKGIKTGDQLLGSAFIRRSAKGFFQVEAYLFRPDAKVAVFATALYYTPPMGVFKKLAELDSIPTEFQKYFAK